MRSHRPYRLSGFVLCALVGILLSARVAHAQTDFGTPSPADALSDAVKANPTLAKEMAKELGSTPEEAVGTAGVLFGIAKTLLKPEDFDLMAKAVPGMSSLLAVVPQDAFAAPSQNAAQLTPGFASSAPASSSSMPATMAAPNGIGSAVAILSKMGINPSMIAKAVPFLTGYIKKNGGKDVGGLLGQVFKTGKK